MKKINLQMLEEVAKVRENSKEGRKGHFIEGVRLSSTDLRDGREEIIRDRILRWMIEVSLPSK